LAVTLAEQQEALAAAEAKAALLRDRNTSQVSVGAEGVIVDLWLCRTARSIGSCKS